MTRGRQNVGVLYDKIAEKVSWSVANVLSPFVAFVVSPQQSVQEKIGGAIWLLSLFVNTPPCRNAVCYASTIYKVPYLAA